MNGQLTPAELEIMKVFWRLGESNVHQVRASLGDDRGYTTISTLVRILEQKGFLRARKLGKQHLYSATDTHQHYAVHAVRDLVNRVFGGQPGALVRTLVDAAPPEADELAAFRELVEELEKR